MLARNSTSSRYADFMARPNKALGHVLVNGQWVQKFKRDPDPESPAGGVSSSVNDLSKWLRLQLADGKFNGKQIVDAKALTETRQPHILTNYNPFNGLPGFYGLAWNVSYDEAGRLRLNHSGAFALGAATHVNLAPTEQLGVVILANAAPTGVVEGLGTIFMETALSGQATHDWLGLFRKVFADPAAIGVVVGFDYSKLPATSSAALPNSAYVGDYLNDYYGDASIVENDGGLAMILGPGKRMFPMKHYDRDTFTYETVGENAVGASGVIFTVGPDGKAAQLVIENLNERGEGRFQRASAEKAEKPR